MGENAGAHATSTEFSPKTSAATSAVWVTAQPQTACINVAQDGSIVFTSSCTQIQKNEAGATFDSL